MARLSDKFEQVARVIKAVAHPDRLAILSLLEHREICVGDIVESLGTKQSVTSQHLNLMRDKDVLQCRRDGARVYYSIKNPNVIRLLHCIYEKCDSIN